MSVRSSVARSTWMPPCATVVAGWLTLATYSYPGFMSLDSIEQLAQARGRAPMSDWHPPVLPLIWSLLDRVIAGPFPMVLLQSGLMLGGLYAVFARLVRPWTAALVTLGVFACPPVLATVAVVWKDSLMAGALVASFAALTSRCAWAQRASLAGLLLATMLRYNAIFAVAPMLVLLSPWPGARGVWTRRAAGLGISVALLVTSQLANRALADVKTYPFHNSVAVYDIAGTLRYADPLSDAEVERLVTGVRLAVRTDIQARARRAFSPWGWWSVVWGEGRLLEPPATAGERDAVAAAWLRVIREHPLAYLKARLRLVRELLGFQKRQPHEPTPWHVFNAESEDRVLLADYGVRLDRGAVQRAWSRWLTDASTTSIAFRAWPYALLAVILLVLLRRDRVMVALLGSALVCEASLFVMAPSPDFRYSFWLVLCSLIAFIVRIVAALRRPAG